MTHVSPASLPPCRTCGLPWLQPPTIAVSFLGVHAMCCVPSSSLSDRNAKSCNGANNTRADAQGTSPPPGRLAWRASTETGTGGVSRAVKFDDSAFPPPRGAYLFCLLRGLAAGSYIHGPADRGEPFFAHADTRTLAGSKPFAGATIDYRRIYMYTQRQGTPR